MLTPLYKKHNKISTNIPLMNATLDGTIFDPKQLKNQIKEYNEAIKNNAFNVSDQTPPNYFNAYLNAQGKLGNEVSFEGFNMALQEDIALLTQSTKGIKILAQHYQSLGGDTAEAAEAQQSFNTMIANANPQVAKMIAQDPSAVIRNTTGAIIKSKIAAFGAQAAYTAMNMAMTMGISFLITTGISALQAIINKTKDLAAAGAEAAETFKKENESLDDYVSKIKEYRKMLASGNTTEKEAYDARTNLLDIQNELYDAYGKEAAGIDLVNGRLSTQLDLLQQLKGKTASDFLTENTDEIINAEKLLKKQSHTFIDLSNGIFQGYSNQGILGEYIGKGHYDLKKVAEKYGFELKKDSEKGSAHTYLSFDGTTEEQVEAWKQLAAEIRNSDTFKQYDDATQVLLKNIDKKLEKLDDETYQNAIQIRDQTAVARIQENDEYLRQYLAITEAINNYQEAIASGDKNAAQKYITEIQSLQDNLKIDDEWVSIYINNLIDKVAGELTKKEYIEKIQNSVEKLFGGLTEGDNVRRIIKKYFKGMSEEQILTYNGNMETMQGRILKEYADQDNISVEKLVAAWVELGYVTNGVNDETQSTVKTYKTLSEELDDVRKKFDKLDNAKTTITSGELLDFDTIDELLKDFPELYDDIVKVAGGYKIEASAIEKARKALVEKQKADAEDDIRELESNKTTINKNIKSYRDKIKEYEKARGIVKEIAYWEKEAALYAPESGDDEAATSIKTPKYSEATSELNRLKQEYEEITDETYEQGNAESIVNQKIVETNKGLVDEKEKLKQVNTSINQEKFLMDALENPVIDLIDKLDTVISKFESIKNVVTQLTTQMYKYGEISPETALQFIQTTPDWSKYLNVSDNKITFKDLNNNELENLYLSGTDYKAQKKELETNASNASYKVDELTNSIEEMRKSGTASDQDLGRMNAKLAEAKRNSNEAADAADNFSKILNILFGTIGSSTALTDFNNTIDDLKHNLAMGLITQDAYDAAYAKALADFRSKATTPEDKDALREAEETDYQQRIAAAQRHYENEKLLLDNALEDNLLSYEQYRDKMKAINEQFYGKGTALGNSEEGKKQYETNLREIAALTKNIYDQELKEIEDQKTMGLITVEEYWKQRTALGEKYLASEASLADEWADEQIQLQTSAQTEQFEEEYKLLERRYKNGEISLTKYIAEYESLWKQYYKDKKQFADEDYETQQTLFEAYKEGIQEQIDAFEAMAEKQIEPYQAEIDVLNEVKDKYDEVMDEKIKALQKQKDALEKANEKQKEENDLLEKKQALEKASIHNRIVYVGGGRWEARRDEDEYKKAKEEYDDALNDNQIKTIEKAIEALEEEKEKRDEAIDKEVKALEETVKGIQAPFDALTKVLTSIIAEQHNVDTEFLNQIWDSPSGAKAIEAYNAAMAKKRETANNYGVDLIGDDDFTKSEANKKSKEAEKNNKTLSQQMKEMGLDIGEFQDKVVKSNQEVAELNKEVITQLISEWEELKKEMADNDAQLQYENNEKLYAKGYEILQKFLDAGYDITQLDGIKYNGIIPAKASKTSSDTKVTAQNTSASKTNTDATKENTEAVKKLTEAEKSTEKAENNKAATESNEITAGGFNLKADENGNLTQVPVMVNGKLVEGKKVKALSKSEWEKRHKISEYAPKGKEIEEDMTYEEYRKRNIVPISESILKDIADDDTRQFIKVLTNSNMKIGADSLNINSTYPTFTKDRSEITENTFNVPNVTFNVNIEGSADEKTVEKFRNVAENEINKFFTDLYSSVEKSYI